MTTNNHKNTVSVDAPAGLSAAQAAQALKDDGPNELASDRPRGL